MEAIVRQACLADSWAIYRLIRGEAKKKRLLSRSKNEIRRFIYQFFVAEVNRKVVGCAALEVYSHRLSEIRSLAVLPRYQRNGLGKMLVDACTERAWSLGVEKLMTVTGSVRFFKKLGFSEATPEERAALFKDPRQWKPNQANRSRK